MNMKTKKREKDCLLATDIALAEACLGLNMRGGKASEAAEQKNRNEALYPVVSLEACAVARLWLHEIIAHKREFPEANFCL